MAAATNIKYRVHLEVLKLKLNKSIDFQTKIVWKRHTNKAETNPVKHSNGFSIFNETLSLEFNMPYNESSQTFLEKKTEIVAVIVYQGKVKSGGYAKYDIADNLNKNPHGKSKVEIPMTQCPDPSAFIEVAFSYERLSDQLEGDNMSVLNVSARDLSMSRIDFHDDKISIEMDRINQTIKKFEQLETKIKQKGKFSGENMKQVLAQLQIVEEEKEKLQKSVKKLERQVNEKQKNLQEQKKKNQEEFQKKQMKKNKDQFEEIYKEKYEAALKELQDLRSGDGKSMSLDIRLAGNLQDVRDIANLENGSKIQEDQEHLEDLARENIQLQAQVASMSLKLAQLFNASYQFGGAKLLDFLQTSIGLTETDQ